MDSYFVLPTRYDTVFLALDGTGVGLFSTPRLFQPIDSFKTLCDLPLRPPLVPGGREVTYAAAYQPLLDSLGFGLPTLAPKSAHGADGADGAHGDRGDKDGAGGAGGGGGDGLGGAEGGDEARERLLGSK